MIVASCSKVAPSAVPWPAVCSRMTIVRPAPALRKESGERFGDEREPVRRAAIGVAARMQHDAEQPQRFGAIELVGHRFDRLPAQPGIRRGEVDQVAGVRDDRRRCRAASTFARNSANFFGRQRPAPPLVGVLREDLERLAAVRPPRGRPRAAARRPPTCERPGVDSSRPLTIAFVVLHRSALPLLLVLTGLAVHAEDWPEFRGPTGQGHSSERGLPLEWSESRNVLWKAAVPGRGWSSPVVAAGRVWVTTATEKGASLRALAFDVETGRELVNTEVVRMRGGDLLNPKNSRASPTPIVEGDRVYVHFGADGTAAITTSGEVVWKVQLRYESQHGNGGSPVLYGDLLILSCDGSDEAFVVALDKRTGKVVWKTPRRQPADQAYSTPLVIRVGDRDEVVSVGAYRAAAVRSSLGPGNLVGGLPRRFLQRPASRVRPRTRLHCHGVSAAVSAGGARRWTGS